MEEFQRNGMSDSDVNELHVPDYDHFGRVDDYWLSYEWSAGGLIHAHIAFWIVGSPRLDESEKSKELGEGVVEVDSSAMGGQRMLLTEKDAKQMAEFWDLLLTEFNVAKAEKGNQDASEHASSANGTASDAGHKTSGAQESSADGIRLDELYNLYAQVGVRTEIGRKAERSRISPESIPYEVLTHCLLDMKLNESEASCRAWDELEEIMSGCRRHVESKASPTEPPSVNMPGASASPPMTASDDVGQNAST